MLAKNPGLVSAVLMTHARTPLRAGELAKATGLPRQIVSAALDTLVKRGLVTRRREGDHDVFAPATDSAYYPGAYLTALVDLPLAAALARFRPIACVIYGSMAIPGRAAPASDLDVMLVGDFPDPAAVREAASAVAARIGRRADVLLLSPEELDRGRDAADPHVVSALAGLRVFGTV